MCDVPTHTFVTHDERAFDAPTEILGVVKGTVVQPAPRSMQSCGVDVVVCSIA